MKDSAPDNFDTIQSHQHYQKFNNKGILNIIGLDSNGLIIYANPAELALSGYDLAEYIGQPFSRFYTSPAAIKQVDEALSTDQDLLNVESSLLCKNGTVKYVIISSRYVKDTAGIGVTYLFCRDITAYKKNENLLSYLNSAAEVLAGARDSNDALRKISSLIVPTFANWFTIDLYRNGKLELIEVAHEDPKYVQYALDYRLKYPLDLDSDEGTIRVFKTGQPLLASHLTPEIIRAGVPDPEQSEMLINLGIYSSIMVAMHGKDAVTGIITFVSSVKGKHFDAVDLRFAQNFANHIGLALENARLNDEALAEIEQRKKIEEELTRTQLQLKSALWSGLIGTWVRDLEKNLLYADESLCALFDIPHTTEGMDPYTLINRIHPEDIAASEKKRAETISTGQDYETEYRILQKDGSVKWAFARGRTELDSNGKPIRFAGVVGDITERKKAEEALKESEERFRLMAETMPQKIFMTDSNAKLLYLSPQWAEYTGFTLNKIKEVSLAHFIHPDDLQDNLKKWFEALKEGKEFKYEHRFRSKDGNYYWHLTRALPLPNNNGAPIWIGSITDIDEQKRNEHRKDEFISIASHELKTPITSLKGYLQIIARMALKDNAPTFPYIAKTLRQASKLSSLVSDLLDVSKMQAGKMNYNFTVFDFSEIVEDAITDSHNTYPSHVVKVDGNLNLKVHGDKHRLEQVLTNLLNNAAKYSPDAKEIIVNVRSDDKELTVTVEDFGVGIPQDKASFVFNRFFRVEETSYKFTGLGIGLFISNEIIQRHNGKLWFSSALGKGSVFSFKIPLEN